MIHQCFFYFVGIISFIPNIIYVMIFSLKFSKLWLVANYCKIKPLVPFVDAVESGLLFKIWAIANGSKFIRRRKIITCLDPVDNLWVSIALNNKL